MVKIFHIFRTFFVALCVFFSALFSTGRPARVTMPAPQTGAFGQYVNPFIGTDGYPWMCGNLFPGAVSPFGAMKLSPDTCTPTGDNLFNWATAGYHYADCYLWGFSTTRLSGTGSRTMGHFRVTPAVGDTDPAKRLDRPLLFSHTYEKASPGYYAVYLPSLGCMTELTATEHVGIQRYTFQSKKDARLFLDATSFLGEAETGAGDGVVRVDAAAGMITGQGTVKTGFAGRAGGFTAYFAATVDREIQSFSTWLDGVSEAGRAAVSGDDVGVNLNFGDLGGEPLELKLAISFVSVENALENLCAEAGADMDFDAVYAATRDAWESWLSRMAVASPDTEILTNFYTALYHAMLMPSSYTDVNGEYLAFNKQTGIAEDYTYRSDISLWDTYRTTQPLYALIAPEIEYDVVKSLLSMADDCGSLPRWPSCGTDSGSMFGSPAAMTIAEAYLKGYTDFDAEAALEYMKRTSESYNWFAGAREGIDYYNSIGYVPADLEKRSVSLVLEYCWADYSIALLAEALGKTEDAARYAEKARNYVNIFDEETKYFRGKNLDGSWVSAFNPNYHSFYDDILGTAIARPYCEGSARQWRWCVPQDAQGLLALFGSADYFVSELEAFMEDASYNLSALDPGAGYWLGNEHDLHAAYLFNEAGRPDLTQKWVRWTLDERFSTAENGIDGNDDGGALSAWYCWSAVGLYPVAGTDRYWIGAPNVDSAVLQLGDGKTLTVTAENQSPQNMYVQSVALNGVRLTSSTLVHAQLADGGTLHFVMGDTPAENGGF